MKIEKFRDYIARFNKQDVTAFEDYLCDDLEVQNGRLVYYGVDGMKAHYASIWKCIDETLNVLHYVGDDNYAGVEMKTNFLVRIDCDESPFGAVKKGEQFDFHGVIFYTFENEKIKKIKVSYLDFVKTELNGDKVSLGIVH
jgi:hypothetical protein